VLEVVFILLEPPSPSRRIFISSHSLPPSLVRRIGFLLCDLGKIEHKFSSEVFEVRFFSLREEFLSAPIHHPLVMVTNPVLQECKPNHGKVKDPNYGILGIQVTIFKNLSCGIEMTKPCGI
jgi:hypothetical protein